MYRTYGNLAVKPVQASATRRLPSRSTAQPAPRAASRPAPSRIVADEECVLCPSEPEMRRNHSTRRARRTLRTALVVLVFTAAALMVVYRQTLVMEQNNEMTKTLCATVALDIETQVVEEKIASRTDLAQVRSLAISRLGMQDPANLQRITVDLPLSDRLLVAPAGSGHAAGTRDDESDVLLKSAMNDLEGFFRTLR